MEQQQVNHCGNGLTDLEKIQQLELFLSQVSKEIVSKSPFVQSLDSNTMSREMASIMGDHEEDILSKIFNVILRLVPWKQWVDKPNKDGLLHLFGVDPETQVKIVQAVSHYACLVKGPFEDESTGDVVQRSIGEQYAWTLILSQAYLWKCFTDHENEVSWNSSIKHC